MNDRAKQLRNISHDGLERSYVLVAPTQQRERFPLVLAFHGGGTNARFMQRFCNLDEIAEQEGIVLVYPNGTGRTRRGLTWNAGLCCGYAQRHNSDDVGFVDRVIDDVGSQLPIDGEAIFATGMSNGGMMSYRLANELSHRFAAIAPVAGGVATETINPSMPVSVFHIHGTADEYVPMMGGRGKRSRPGLIAPKIQQSIDAWVAANGCSSSPEQRMIESSSYPQRESRYLDGRDGTEVRYLVIEGGGHTWPGQETHLEFELGPVALNIDANALIWEFFDSHRRKS